MANQKKILAKGHPATLSRITPPVRKGVKAQKSKITNNFSRNKSIMS